MKKVIILLAIGFSLVYCTPAQKTGDTSTSNGTGTSGTGTSGTGTSGTGTTGSSTTTDTSSRSRTDTLPH